MENVTHKVLSFRFRTFKCLTLCWFMQLGHMSQNVLSQESTSSPEMVWLLINKTLTPLNISVNGLSSTRRFTATSVASNLNLLHRNAGKSQSSEKKSPNLWCHKDLKSKVPPMCVWTTTNHRRPLSAWGQGCFMGVSPCAESAVSHDYDRFFPTVVGDGKISPHSEIS